MDCGREDSHGGFLTCVNRVTGETFLSFIRLYKMSLMYIFLDTKIWYDTLMAIGRDWL